MMKTIKYNNVEYVIFGPKEIDWALESKEFIENL